MRVEENKPLAPLTTLGVGGPARYFCEVSSEQEIPEACNWASQRNLPLFILGGGSNLVVSDAGFNGLVLHIALRGIKAEENPNSSTVLFAAAAGENWDSFVQQAVEANCSGIECLAGIPGTVGGTPVQNVGAYGQEVSSVIEQVRAYDLQQQVFVEFSAAECDFSYRRSRFNSTDKGRYIVTRVDFLLERNGAPTLKYADLQHSFPANAQPTLSEVAATVRSIRQSKGMLLVEGDPDCRSAGSFFKNPVVTVEALHVIAEAAGKQPPSFPAADTSHAKIPAAWLIEQSGFAKGYIRGAAGVSSRHTLALTNRGNATAADILALAEEIRAAVQSKFGVQLEMEPVLLGF
jgi:UDP-N-acetylmuramate dehydrogenase